MSGTGLVLFGDVSVPAPLSVRLLRYPYDTVLRVIVDGPPGAVELQIRPGTPDSLILMMSIEYHSRQPMAAAQNPMPHCEALSGVDCYPDGATLNAQNEFETWFRARDSQAIIDELVRQHQRTSWTLDDNDTPLIVDVQPEPAWQLPAGGVQP
ncbi:hypothetical protein [Umezawaea sp. Da 62-37]|uniref:hypothetical protein n=1 Tax=Umezawaea sp. Da 62-37 TaxID=3075927 RepID=UPI0028F702F1|nr:hypothetical protein [Umezawaea sp. Da 62-37]WNV83131.1 hypothetical protein RM788_33760 [Umezawaea sp. Da 62-37]